MTVLVVDASVLLASEDGDDALHDRALALLEGSTALATVDLAFYEVTNVSVARWGDEAATRRLLARVEAIAADGGIVRCSSPLLSRAAAIAREHTISVYDAAYVAAAESLDGTVVSCDVRDLVSRGLAVLPHDAIT